MAHQQWWIDDLIAVCDFLLTLWDLPRINSFWPWVDFLSQWLKIFSVDESLNISVISIAVINKYTCKCIHSLFIILILQIELRITHSIKSIIWFIQVKNFKKLITLIATHTNLSLTHFYSRAGVGLWAKSAPWPVFVWPVS